MNSSVENILFYYLYYEKNKIKYDIILKNEKTKIYIYILKYTI